jgi:hypothetical protein
VEGGGVCILDAGEGDDWKGKGLAPEKAEGRAGRRGRRELEGKTAGRGEESGGASHERLDVEEIIFSGKKLFSFRKFICIFMINNLLYCFERFSFPMIEIVFS